MRVRVAPSRSMCGGIRPAASTSSSNRLYVWCSRGASRAGASSRRAAAPSRWSWRPTATTPWSPSPIATCPPRTIAAPTRRAGANSCASWGTLPPRRRRPESASSPAHPASPRPGPPKRERVTVFVRGLDLAGTAECTRGCPAMNLEESPEQQELRAELRQYYADLLTDEVRAGLAEGGEGGEAWSQVVRQIGKDGWLGIGWPKEFGGQGRPATDQFIFFDETRRAGAPFPFVTINTVGPTIMRYGTEEQKSFFLPQILAGELNFAIGYTEPEAGTDLASLRTRAVRDGDEYVVNGAKIFTSGADEADYVWLACRTDPDVPKHKGISILCVPTTSPGFEWSIIHTVGGLTTTQTFYDNVHVPVANRVGDENEGWRMITTQLNHERVGLAAWSGLAISLYQDIVDWAAAQPTDDGKTLMEQGWVQMDLAKCHAELEAMWLLNWRMAVHVNDGDLTGAESSSIKVFGTERIIEVTRLLLGIVGAAGYLVPGSPGAVLRGRVEATGRQAQINTFGGGVNEVQREIVATAGLGMTRGAR